MNLGQRLKNLRRDLHLSQEEIGGHGFVSAPGWIKIENGQRLPSDRLIVEIVRWLVKHKHLASGSSEHLREELLTLKYLGHRSEFVRGLAQKRFDALQKEHPEAPVLTPASLPEGTVRRRQPGRPATMSPRRTTKSGSKQKA